jgi:hypothetical protein
VIIFIGYIIRMMVISLIGLLSWSKLVVADAATDVTVNRTTPDFFTSIDVSMEDKKDNPLQQKWLLKEFISYGTQAPGVEFSRQEEGINRVETSLSGQLQYRISERFSATAEVLVIHDAVYRLRDQIEPSQDEVDTLETRVEARDIYLDVALMDLWHIRAGNQIIAFGQTESLVISDLIAPHNNYTLFQADLKNTRLAVPGLQLSRSDEVLTLDSVITYKAGFNQLAPEGNEFDPFILLRSWPLVIRTQKSTQEYEYLLRLKRSFRGGDLSIVAADVNHNELSLQHTKDNVLLFGQERIQALALSSSINHEFWVFKGEMGTHFNKPQMPKTAYFMNYLQGWPERDQQLAMLGFDYVGLGDVTVSLEINYTHTSDDLEQLDVEKNVYGTMASVYWSDANDKLNINAYGITMPSNSGHIFRINADYKLTDQLKIGGQWVAYSAQKNKSLYPYSNNDAAQLFFIYNF